MRRFFRILGAMLAALLLAGPLPAQTVNVLQRGFEQPPDNSKIRMRWWWFGPAVTRPELEREMALMKQGGIGGFEVQPTYPLSVDDPQTGIRNLPFGSPEFLDRLGFTAAKAKELGLRMDLTLGSGWPYGGPQFSANEAAGRLRAQEVAVASGQKRVPVPTLRPAERIVAAFAGSLSEEPATPAPPRLLRVENDAALLPDGGAGAGTVTFMIAGQTGMRVKRAAVGGEGFVIDHYNPVVIEKFLREIAEPAVRACGPNPPYAVFCDSLEVGGEDWTTDFLREFQKRRGYDLTPWLPALFTNIGPQTADIRHDWGQTLTELFNDHFNTALKAFAHRHDTRYRIQGYGTPPASLHSYAFADLCEGEGYTWRGFRESRWAASASHLLGRPVTSSETWTWLHSPVFRATPLDMKAEADLHFLQGVNQLIGHGWPYTPPGVPYPGWRFYASAVFNEKNPWWIVMPDVARYLQRVSFALRQGRPASDVLLYLPNSDAWASFTPGRVAMNAALSRRLGDTVIPNLLDAGYNFDFVDDGLLALRGKPDKGTLAFGDVHYRVVVLPGVERIPVATLQTLERFVGGGGILVATRRLPDRAPGFRATGADQKAVRDTVRRLFTGPNAPSIFVEDEAQIGAALATRLRPDVVCAPAAPAIGVVHRTTGDAEIFFVANTANTPQNVRATFRVANMQPEWWDPMTGEIAPAEIVARPAGGNPAGGSPAGGITVAIALPPYGSRLLVFTHRRLPERPSTPDTSSNYSPPFTLDLSTDWRIAFTDNSGKSIAPQAMHTLRSWTDDETTRFFSGTATYTKTVTVPGDLLRPGRRVVLDFGEATPREAPARARFQALLDAPIREAAVVYVNDRRAGSVWAPPYRVDVTDALRPGDNEIRVEVANLAVNALARQPLRDYRNEYADLITRYGDRFQPQDMNEIRPEPSGLLGPVRLVGLTPPPPGLSPLPPSLQGRGWPSPRGRGLGPAGEGETITTQGK